MGHVYRATAADGSEVALKLIHWDLLGDEVSRRRFAREAGATTGVSDPHLVRVLEAGEHAGTPFIVQELVRGGSLQSLLDDAGPLGVPATIRVCQQVASGLDALHEVGVIHRDLKPANILLADADGAASITDFGLAKQRDATALTRRGQALGSMHYVSPEQIRGEKVAPTADVYSLGCVVWACLCGGPPFADHEGMRVLWAHLQEPAPDPCAKRADLLPSLGWAIRLALEKDPARRPPTAGAYSHIVTFAAVAPR
jgi:serine/threonine-protein kinase